MGAGVGVGPDSGGRVGTEDMGPVGTRTGRVKEYKKVSITEERRVDSGRVGQTFGVVGLVRRESWGRGRGVVGSRRVLEGDDGQWGPLSSEWWCHGGWDHRTRQRGCSPEREGKECGTSRDDGVPET